MKPISEYLDYRRYLADFYAEHKESSKAFSYRYFAAKGGLGSPSLLKHVIDGERNLTGETAPRFAKALGLQGKDRAIFLALVGFNQAHSPEEKRERFLALREHLGKLEEDSLAGPQESLFDQWYLPVLRELVAMFDFKDDWESLALHVSPQIKAQEAKGGVKALMDMGLLTKTLENHYVQSGRALRMHSPRNAMTIRNFNKTMLKHSEDGLLRYATPERHVSGITLGASSEAYSLLKDEIEAFKDRVKRICAQDAGKGRVYQLTLALVPMSSQKLSSEMAPSA